MACSLGIMSQWSQHRAPDFKKLLEKLLDKAQGAV